MTQAFNLGLLANKVNSSGNLDASTGLVNATPIANGGTNLTTLGASGNMLIATSASAVSAVEIPSFGFKNRIINGAMVNDQRNAGASFTPTADNTYTLDRWIARLSATSKYSVQQVVDAPDGFINSLKVISLSAYSLGASDYFQVGQYLEGLNVQDLMWGTSTAKTITVSFWVKSSLTGTFGGTIFGYQTGIPSYPFSYTVSSANTWEQKTLTITGPTRGTINTTNSGCFVLLFSLGVGSTLSGTANTWNYSTLYRSPTGATSVVGTNGATFYITGVQLEKGSTATSFDYRPYGTELQLCQRYFVRPALGFGGAVQGSTAITFLGGYPVAMRTTPTVSVASALSIFQTGIGGTFSQSSASGGINASINSNTSYAIECGNFSGLTNAWPVALNAGTINISAEL